MRKVRNIKRVSKRMPALEIEINQEDILSAVRHDSHRCMIANSIKKRIPDAQYISVDIQSIRFTDPKTKIRYKYFTPKKGQQELVNFDQGHEVKPFGIKLQEGLKYKAGWERNGVTKRKVIPVKERNKTGKTRPHFSKKERKFGIRSLE